MADAVEATPNIGKALGKRVRAVGITTREDLEQLGDQAAFRLLVQRFPEDACTHTRLALSGAVRGIRWWYLPPEVKAAATAGLDS